MSQQTGAFSWSYPIKVPASLGGPAPSLSLAYNSGSVDGRTSGTNAQGSWIGDGWDMWPGFIERSYRGCADDRDTKEKPSPNNADVRSGDLCWFSDNATMSFNGSSSELVKVTASETDDDKDKVVQYRGVSDDGAKIELIKGGPANGDADKSYWRITAIDGTRYFYGLDEGEGGATAGTKTNSVWTVPVYSNHSDEPGYNKEFAKSRNDRAWRWNLDFVVDPLGNTMTYFYTAETGAYGREGDEDKRTTYDRGGWLKRIEYGSRTDAAAEARPAARILFDVAERCVATSCFKDDKPKMGKYPDTPWHQYCDKAPCTEKTSPTFWTQQRLTKITTQTYVGIGDDYTTVDSWTLDHTYLMAGVNEGKPMWLKSITHTAHVTDAGPPGTVAVKDPAAVFDPNADVMANRVVGKGDSGHSSLFRNRIAAITTESGAQIGITYSKEECVFADLPEPSKNTKPCFPQYYGVEGEQPVLDWFHKFRVTRIDVYDNTGGFQHEQTHYDYLDTPAWAYDDSELVPPKRRTWGQYRGYGKVRVRVGLDAGVQSKVDYLYFRGMSGDKIPKSKDDVPPTGRRDVDVTDSFGTKIADHPAFAGMVREEITYDGDNWISGKLHTPEADGPTATSGPLKAWKTHVATSRARTKLASGATRWTKTITKVNGDNLPEEVDDLGDESTAADDLCVRTQYARNEGIWMLDRVKQVETVGVACTAATQRPRDVLGQTRTYYDDRDEYGAKPTKGIAVRVEELESWDGTTPKFVTTGQTGHDKLGRVTWQSDALGRKSRTDYYPELTGPVTKTVTWNPKNWSTTTTLHPALGVPLKTVDDANNTKTEMTYDPAGRLLQIWAPGYAKGTHLTTPNVNFTYKLQKNAPSYVVTKTLVPYGTGNYRTSVTVLDGLLRTRQTQTQTVAGGRAIVDTVYDSRGLVDWVSNPYYDGENAAPKPELVGPDGRPEIPSVTQNVYDGASRLKAAALVVAGIEKWRTTMTYAGERVTVTPPGGGTATTSITDARGNQVELRQYKDRAKAGQDGATLYDSSTYTYDRLGRLATVKDALLNTWGYSYDLRGRRILDEDPDKGKVESRYDAAGQLTWTKDARNRELFYKYDDLGRKENVRRGAQNGQVLAEWKYDSLPYGKGRLTSSTRFEYDAADKALAYVNAVTKYNADGQPAGTATTVPQTADGLCVSGEADPCTFTTGLRYHESGNLYRVDYAKVADLPTETMQLGYNNVGLPTGLLGDLGTTTQKYVGNVVYNQLNQLISQEIGGNGRRTAMAYGIDEPTGRRVSFRAIPELKTDVYDLTYGYDEAGTITEIADSADGQKAEKQCFRYDHQRRLTEAWTPRSLDCSAAPSATALDGPAPYWRSYTYDAVGNRLTEVINGSTKTTRTSAYPPAAKAAGSKPHAATSIIDTDANKKELKKQQYIYDPAGNMLCRPAATAANTCATDGLSGTEAQILTWNDEGHLARSKDKTGDTSYVYDADGNRLIRRDPAGAILYLPQGQEIRKPKSTGAIGTRYYSNQTGTVAVRTGANLTWMVNDHLGTGTATVTNDANLTVSRRRILPFGETRGIAPTTWAGDKGYVGGTQDNTGLTHLGAREYDPVTGRFISVDPLLDTGDPQQWNGYAYANNTPISASDPSGLIPDGCRESDCFGYNPTTGCPGGCGTVDNVNWGKRNGKSSTAPQTAKRKYSGRAGDGRAVPNTAAGEQWTPEYYAEWKYNTHSSNHPAVLEEMCSDLGVGCDGLVGGPGVNWLSLADGAVALAMLAMAPEIIGGCLVAVVVCAEEATSFYGSGSLFGAAGGARLAAAGAAKGAVGRPCSFTADTPVLMADGSHKPIGDIVQGDQVLATDPVSGETADEAVVAVPGVKWHDDLVDVDVKDPEGSGAGTIRTTSDHPFWDVAEAKWVDASDLRSGTRLRQSDGAAAVVEDVNLPRADRPMYNLTVNRLHTYYVMAGNTPVLVHNCGGLGNGLKNSSDGLKGIFGDGGVRGKSIIDVRSQLLDDGFSQGLTKNKKGYLFQNGTGEEVRIMRRGGGWDVRVRNANGNYLDEFGNVAKPADTHGIEVHSR